MVSAKTKNENFSIWLMQVDGCNSLFFVEQEPDPFLSNAERVKVKSVERFRQGTSVLDNFPEEIRLKVYYRSNPGGLIKCRAAESFDPGAVKFSAAWRNKSRTLVANGTLLHVERHAPEPLCEDQCKEFWSYDLRIESRDVPLTDNLQLTVDAADGRHIAKLTGGLGSVRNSINPVLLP